MYLDVGIARPLRLGRDPPVVEARDWGRAQQRADPRQLVRRDAVVLLLLFPLVPGAALIGRLGEGGHGAAGPGVVGVGEGRARTVRFGVCGPFDHDLRLQVRRTGCTFHPSPPTHKFAKQGISSAGCYMTEGR